MLLSSKPRRGFGAWDLIIVTFIVSLAVFVLAALVSGVTYVREGAARTQTNNNLKCVALIAHSWNDVYRTLPPAFDEKFGVVDFPASLHVHLLPFMEQSVLFEEFVQSKGDGKTMAILWPYISPSDSTIQANGAGVQNFPANLRVFSVKGFNTPYDTSMPPLEMVEPAPRAAIGDLADGTSNTILFATKFATCGDGGSYYAADPASKRAAFFGQNPATRIAHASSLGATFQLRPGPNGCMVSPLMAQSFQTGGLSVALADGAIRMIAPTMSAETWNRVMQPNDGHDPGSDWNH